MKKNRLFSIVLLIALFLGLMLFVKNYKEDGQEIVPPVIEETTNLGELVVNEGTSNKLKLTKKMNAANQNSIQVNATVNPDDVLNDKLTWTLDWSGSYNENVSDYVTMQISSDTHSVTLTYKKVFNRQLILKATSELTPSVNATLTIDCYERTVDLRPVFLLFDADQDDMVMGGEVDNINNIIDMSAFTYDMLETLKLGFGDEGFCQEIDYNGTISVERTTALSISLSDELKSKLQTAGISLKDSAMMYSYELINGYYVATIYEMLSGLINITTSNKENVIKVLGSTSYWFNAEYVVYGYNGSFNDEFTKTYKLQGFNLSSYVNVTDITLDKTEIIF